MKQGEHMKFTIHLGYDGFIELVVDTPVAMEALQKAREQAEGFSDEEIAERINLSRSRDLDEIVACEKSD